MKELYGKHKKLIWTGIILSVLTILLGVNTIVSDIKSKKIAEETIVLDVDEYTQSVKGYDVSGLTQEEIKEYLSIIRESEGNK